MAKKITQVRGAKTQAIIAQAKSKDGCTGADIMRLTGWPSGSAGWRIGTLADRLDMDCLVGDRRENGTVPYFLVPKAAAKKNAKAAA